MLLLSTCGLTFYGEKCQALLTAPLTPLLTRSLGEVSLFDSFIFTSYYYLTYFFFRDASLYSSRFSITFAQNCNWRTKPSPGWIHGLPFFTLSLAQSYPTLNVLMMYAITNELLLDTPAQQCIKTPPRFLPSPIRFVTQSKSYVGSFCCLLS